MLLAQKFGGVIKQDNFQLIIYWHYGKKCVIAHFIYLHCWKCVLMKSTCEREILKLFWVTKCKGFNSLKLQKNNEEKSYKLITLILWKKNYAFSSDCRLQIRINYLKSQCNQWGRLIGINGQLAVCISKVIIFKQYIVTGLPVRPSYKFSFLSSVYKNGLPGEGRHEGLVLRNDVLTNGFIWFSLAWTLARILFVPRLRSPWKTHKALRTWRRLFALFEAIRPWE